MKKIFTILSIAFLAVCCQKEEEHSDRFEVNGLKDTYSFAADLGQKESFKVISDNVLWEVTFNPEDQDWLVITPMRSLGGYQTVTITPDNNDSPESRSCTFTVTSEKGYTKTVTVSQRGI